MMRHQSILIINFVGLIVLARHGFDFVVGSDIAYMPKHIPELAETIAFFLAEQGDQVLSQNKEGIDWKIII
eukprot:762876-Amphidinium_carterae.1